MPEILFWPRLSPRDRSAALQRPAQRDVDALLSRVREIVSDVRARGDEAILEYTRRFDCPTLERLEVEPDEFAAAERVLSPTQLLAIERAIANVRRFHDAQAAEPLVVSTSPGVVCERHSRAIDAVGLYVPAGVAPLPSTAVMLAVPAQVAGCRTRIIATPPQAEGRADPAVLAIARRCGVERVFKMGGAQAIAAMAYGTRSVPKVDKVFGPGSAWVTAAKMICANDPEGAALDLPAGPSEVLVIADDAARPDFVAADLLAQAEHSNDAQAILVTPSQALAESVAQEIAAQLRTLDRIDTLNASLGHARLIVVETLEAAFELSNDYAPEHLIVQVRDARSWLPRIRNAGSVFLGAWTPETMGDYCSGANHVLPTYGFARAHSGLSLDDFIRRMTVQELTPAGLEDLGPTAVELAALEGLDAHANAVRVRLAHLSGSIA